MAGEVANDENKIWIDHSTGFGGLGVRYNEAAGRMPAGEFRAYFASVIQNSHGRYASYYQGLKIIGSVNGMLFIAPDHPLPM